MRRKRYLSRTRSNNDVVSTIKKFFVKIINFGIVRKIYDARREKRNTLHDIHAIMLPFFESKIDFYHLERALPYRDSSKNFLNVNKEIKSMSISRIYDSFWL